jgi:predicted peptidase
MAAPPATSPIGPDELVVRSFASAKAALALPYRLYVPRDYVQTKRYPLLVVLHGVGERGTDNLAQLANGVLAFCAPALQKRKPSFVVYPQCPPTARWVEAPWSEPRYQLGQVAQSKPLIALMELIDSLQVEFTLDPRRLLVSGLSMGGQGTWDLLARFPERFAGAMPVCGNGDPDQAGRMKAVPVWAFHGARDNIVPVAASRTMVQALKRAGGRVRYSEYPDVAHAAWERAYADKKAIEWLLAQRQPAPRPQP